jgi:hypothetical protein
VWEVPKGPPPQLSDKSRCGQPANRALLNSYTASLRCGRSHTLHLPLLLVVRPLLYGPGGGSSPLPIPSTPLVRSNSVPWKQILDKWVELVSQADVREEQQSRHGFALVTPDAGRRRRISARVEDAIVVAALYEQEASLSPRRAAARTADRLRVEVKDVYVALQVARRKGWLTAVQQGRSGGELTEEGRIAFQELEGQKRLDDFLRLGKKKK